MKLTISPTPGPLTTPALRIKYWSSEVPRIEAAASETLGHLAQSAEELASEWLDRRIEGAVRGDPEHASSIGVEGVRAMKQDLAHLKARLSQLIENFAAEVRAVESQFIYTDSRDPNIADSLKRVVLAEADPIVQRHGFTASPRRPYSLPTTPDRFTAAAERYADTCYWLNTGRRSLADARADEAADRIWQDA